LILAALAGGILTAGWLYYHYYKANFRAEAEHQLEAIADLKVAELVQWRRERRDDAALLCNNEAVSTWVRRWLANPEDGDALRPLQLWLGRFQQHGDVDAVRLLDARGLTRLAIPAGLPPVSAGISRRVPEVLRAGRVDFYDFHRNEYDHRIYLDVLVPIFEEAPVRRPLGLIELRINPDRYLYPFIRRWPVPSATAETLLVRREDSRIVFLNDLRFRTNTALNLQLPLTQVSAPSVQAARGRFGLMEGVDYRGTPVLAATRAVPDSPWLLVARMDLAEIDAPLRERRWLTLVVMAALWFGVGTGVVLLWRRQALSFYRERAATAEALAQSERMLQNVLENFPGLAFWKDARLNYLGCNQLFAITAGFKSPADLIGKSDLELPWAETEAALYRADDAAVMASGRPKLNIVEQQHQSGGRVAWFETSKIPLRDSTGKIIGVLGVASDITERRQAEEKLITIMKAVESTSDAVGISDAQGRHFYQNRAYTDLYGYATAEELQAAGGGAATVRDPAAARELFATILSGKPWAGELELVTKSGRVFTGYERADAILDQAGRLIGVIGIITDITERKRAEEHLRRALAELERSNRELEHFAYVASHDLQEPLRMVASYTQLLAKHFEGRLDEKGRKYVHYAVDGAVRMQTLINDLLTYSRVGKQGKPLAATDSHVALGGALRNLSVVIAESHAVITNDHLPEVRADAAQLILLFQNLLANAIKFQRDALPRIHVTARPQGGEWWFSVRDNGIGIPAQYAERVFVIFQRLHTREEYPGTGIGLAVCRRIVEHHGGKIWFESQPGEGTTFFFTIPACLPGPTADIKPVLKTE